MQYMHMCPHTHCITILCVNKIVCAGFQPNYNLASHVFTFENSILENSVEKTSDSTETDHVKVKADTV